MLGFLFHGQFDPVSKPTLPGEAGAEIKGQITCSSVLPTGSISAGIIFSVLGYALVTGWRGRRSSFCLFRKLALETKSQGEH
jgi:hypothetical protein